MVRVSTIEPGMVDTELPDQRHLAGGHRIRTSRIDLRWAGSRRHARDGLVAIPLCGRQVACLPLGGDDCIEFGDNVVADDRHVESAGHGVAALRPELPRQVSQSAGFIYRTGFGEDQSLHLRL